jgi:CRP-like cAMP-binding protein
MGNSPFKSVTHTPSISLFNDPFREENHESLVNALCYFFEISRDKQDKFQELVSTHKFDIRHTHVPIGTNVISPGEKVDGLYIIDSGKVKVIDDDDTKELYKGNHFGILSCVSKTLTYQPAATTLTDCWLWFIDSAELARIKYKFLSDENILDVSLEGAVKVIPKMSVRFNTTVQVVLMATKEEYKQWGVKDDIWYQQSDYDRFRFNLIFFALLICISFL